MQITSTQARSPLFTNLSVAEQKTPSAARTSSTAEEIHAVKGQYDMTNITPREIDQAAQDLVEAGFTDVKTLGRLLTKGADFRAHLETHISTARAETGIDYRLPDFDPEQRIDLVAQSEESLSDAQSAGEDTTLLKEHLRFLKSFWGSQTVLAARETTLAAAAEAALESASAALAYRGAERLASAGQSEAP